MDLGACSSELQALTRADVYFFLCQPYQAGFLLVPSAHLKLRYMHLEPNNVTASKLDLFHCKRIVLTSQWRLILSRSKLVNYHAE